MLILERKEGMGISIGNDIVVWVERIRGNKCRLAIEAPKDIAVFRNELLRQSVQTFDEARAIHARKLTKGNEK